MTKILIINGGLLLKGGTENFIMNILRSLDPQHYQVDVVVHGFDRGYYDDEIKAMGMQLLYVPIKGQDPIKNKQALTNIIKNGKYDVIHAHLNDQNGPVLKLAKKYGIPVRISHSHSSQSYSSNPLKQFLGKQARRSIVPNSTALFACSASAGKYLYDDEPFEIIPNAIDTNHFLYDESKRTQVREQYHLEDALVYGHIGWFNEIKNHTEIITMFNEIQKQQSNARLLLIGEGDLLEATKAQVEKLNLSDKVIFAGMQSDVAPFLSAMDAFLMPSLFEGLPYVLVEAQTSGLPIYCSDTIDKDIKLTDLVTFLPLNDTDTWVNTILNKELPVRQSRQNEMIEQGYDLQTTIDKIHTFYNNK